MTACRLHVDFLSTAYRVPVGCLPSAWAHCSLRTPSERMHLRAPKTFGFRPSLRSLRLSWESSSRRSCPWCFWIRTWSSTPFLTSSFPAVGRMASVMWQYSSYSQVHTSGIKTNYKFKLCKFTDKLAHESSQQPPLSAALIPSPGGMDAASSGRGAA